MKIFQMLAFIYTEKDKGVSLIKQKYQSKVSIYTKKGHLKKIMSKNSI